MNLRLKKREKLLAQGFGTSADHGLILIGGFAFRNEVEISLLSARNC